MRGRTSLLSHIILSNEKFVGMGESNATYTGFLRLKYMKLKCLGFRQMFSFFTKHFVDQINHNRKTPNQDLLMSPKVRLLVLVRNPQDSIESIMNLTKKHYEPWSYEKASQYYCDRLQFLDEICSKKTPDDFLFVNSDLLIQQTEKTLQKLSDFLRLSPNLKPEYTSFSYTGVKGDPSKNISSGKILKTELISTDFLKSNDQASLAYLKFVEKYSSS